MPRVIFKHCPCPFHGGWCSVSTYHAFAHSYLIFVENEPIEWGPFIQDLRAAKDFRHVCFICTAIGTRLTERHCPLIFVFKSKSMRIITLMSRYRGVWKENPVVNDDAEIKEAKVTIGVSKLSLRAIEILLSTETYPKYFVLD